MTKANMQPVSFVRTRPEALGELRNERELCVTCGSTMSTTAAHGSYQQPLSLDELMVVHPHATYFVRVGTEDGVAAHDNTYLGVRTGDVLTIDRAGTPTVGSLVLAVCEGAFVLCRYTEHEGKRFLVCDDRTSQEVLEQEAVRVWGVVRGLTRML